VNPYVITEKDLTKSIRQLLKTLGVFHWKAWQGMGSTPGVPDIVGICPGTGRFLGIEVKRPRSKLSPHQERFINAINNAGGLAFVAYSVDDVIRGLNLQDRFLNFDGEIVKKPDLR